MGLLGDRRAQAALALLAYPEAALGERLSLAVEVLTCSAANGDTRR